jgi:Rrf2 family protein
MRLQLTRRGDYAVRAVLALTEADRVVATPELAERMEIPVNFLPQIMPGLVRRGILKRRLGRHGGYELARPAESITLLEVIEAGEATTPTPPPCVLRGDRCNPSQPCRIHPAVTRASEAMRSALAAANFASLRNGASFEL